MGLRLPCIRVNIAYRMILNSSTFVTYGVREDQ
jgi:hypothetical protein